MALWGALSGAVSSASADAGPTTTRIDLWADRDDDDADGVPDGEQTRVGPDARADVVALDARLAGHLVQSVRGADHARVLDRKGSPVPWQGTLPASGWLQGLTPGRVELAIDGGTTREGAVVIDVLGLEMRDGTGSRVDMARSHASLERLPPSRVEGSADGAYDDFDALRAVLIAPLEHSIDPSLRVESWSAEGKRLDVLPGVTLRPSTCGPPQPQARCWASDPLRLVVDDADRDHPLAAGRSLKALVGGAVVFRYDGRKAQMIRVLGPRGSPAGSIGRLRLSLRAVVLRAVAGGPPAVGSTDAGALDALRTELAAASATWGQCGVSLGDVAHVPIRIVDPPPADLLALGGDLGLFASGGVLRLRAGGHALEITTRHGQSPDSVAAEIARAAARAGLHATISPNARITPAMGPSVDVLLRGVDGRPVTLEREAASPLSTDATLGVRIGSVDLTEGLDHFSDEDANAGTLEERTLLKSIDEGDPSTVTIAVIPLFAGGARIGESFIGSDLSSLRNTVVVDRAGMRMRKSSRTLAHELGHVLMDLPDHPDDYGIDTPTLLMDSDASDESAFGPRRLSLEECARVLRQSGPGGRVPLLADWPVRPIPAIAAGATRTPRE